MIADIDLVAEAGDWAKAGEIEALARRAACSALAVASEPNSESMQMVVLLTDDARVRELNREWRGVDRPTNVLSFPSSGPQVAGQPRRLGDIALAFETVAREAESEGKSLADHSTHLIVHGVLHLLGFDHQTQTDAEAMEALERQALDRLGIADPYRDIAA